MNQKERMLASRPYFCDDALNAEQAECREKLARLRAVSDFDKSGEREALIRDIFGAAGENPHINSPFYCDYTSATTFTQITTARCWTWRPYA